MDIETLCAAARARTGLADFGPGNFREPLGVLIASIAREAELTERGLAAQTERLINALANRLRKVALLRAHPEIHDEPIEVAFVITSLPRTGSTFLQRLLGASPHLTATRWWETIFPLPLEGEARHENHLRLQQADALIRMITGAAEGLDAIHPMDPLAHDEDLMIVEQSFISTMPEAMMWVPSYGAYVLRAEDSWVWDELADYLKILQWQRAPRAGLGQGARPPRWILKSPNHMQHIGAILRRFPQARVLMTHRDLRQVMGSWFSLAESLRCADSDAPRRQDNVAHWLARWQAGLTALAAARAASPARFIDIAYADLIADPIGAARAIHERGGLDFDPATESALRAWLAAHPRDARPSHRYDLAEYGVEEAALRARFAGLHAE